MLAAGEGVSENRVLRPTGRAGGCRWGPVPVLGLRGPLHLAKPQFPCQLGVTEEPTPWGWGRSRDSGQPAAGQRCLTLVLGQRRWWHDGHLGTAGRGRMVACTACTVPGGPLHLQPSCCLPCPGPSHRGPPQPSLRLHTAHAPRVHPRGTARAHGGAQWAQGAQREGTAGGHLWGPADQGEQERASEADSNIGKGSPGGQGAAPVLV